MSPVIVVANTLSNALVLGTTLSLLTLFTILFVSFTPKSAPYTIRVILYVLSACAMYLPISFAVSVIFQETVLRLGIFLPLLVTNSLIVHHTEMRFLRQKRGIMCLDVLMHCVGFFVVILIVGLIREVFGNATFMGHPLTSLSFKHDWLMLPFGGFILLGFLVAMAQRSRLYFAAKQQATPTIEGENV